MDSGQGINWEFGNLCEDQIVHSEIRLINEWLPQHRHAALTPFLAAFNSLQDTEFMEFS